MPAHSHKARQQRTGGSIFLVLVFSAQNPMIKPIQINIKISHQEKVAFEGDRTSFKNAKNPPEFHRSDTDNAAVTDKESEVITLLSLKTFIVFLAEEISPD
jgi:hypothetical protein